MTRFLLAAACGAAFVLPGFTAAEAQTYGAQSRYATGAPSYEQCVAQQRNRQVAGAVIGGVLGAVLGAEIHDDHQDRARDDRRYRNDRGYRGRNDRYRGNRGHRGYRGHDTREAGNDGAVIAGVGLGALAGGALGGASSDCNRYARASGSGQGYGAAPGHYGSGAGYRGDPRYASGGYNDPRYDTGRYDTGGYASGGYASGGYESGGYGSGGYPAGDDGYRYDDRRTDDGYGYDDGNGRSSGELLGGPESRSYEQSRSAQVYTAGSAQGSATAASGACRDMQSAGRLVYMCQGSDGIWRPAESYR